MTLTVKAMSIFSGKYSRPIIMAMVKWLDRLMYIGAVKGFMIPYKSAIANQYVTASDY